MSYYPIFLDIDDKIVLVIGGGPVAQRKIETLLDYGVSINIVSKELTEKLRNMVLDGNPTSVSFQSTLSAVRMIWIYLSNAIAIVFSLGLLIPWASVRTVRYRLSNLVVYSSGDLDTFVASEQEKVEAVGEEVAEFLDFDLGI